MVRTPGTDHRPTGPRGGNTLAATLVWLAATLGGTSADDRPTPLRFSRHDAFAVPFRVTAPADPAAAPREVFLYVSSDQGRHWQLADRTDPAAGRFQVRELADGEQWFLVRTLTQAGKFSAVQPRRPDLRVVVDTVPPEVHMAWKETSGRRIAVEFVARDPHLDRQQVQLQYQRTADGPWQTVADVEYEAGDERQRLSGSASWEAAAGRVWRVRLRAGDRAGNEATAHTPLADPPNPAAASGKAAHTPTGLTGSAAERSRGGAAAAGPDPAAAIVWPPNQRSALPLDPHPPQPPAAPRGRPRPRVDE